MKKFIIIFCVLLVKNVLTLPCRATSASGNAVTTVGGCRGHQTSTVPLVTEVIPNLQFGDVNVSGDIPIGGSIKVSGCFPVYGVVSVDGALPSCGAACINAGGCVVAASEPCCRVC